MRAAAVDARFAITRNLVVNPALVGTPGSPIFYWSGMTALAGGGSVTTTAAYNDNITAKPGQRISAQLLVKAQSAGSWNLSIRETKAALFGAQPTAAFTSVALAAAEERVVNLTGIVTASDSDGVRLLVNLAGLEVHGAIVVRNSFPAAYADGNTPGWRWLGTPGASASVGYPKPA